MEVDDKIGLIGMNKRSGNYDTASAGSSYRDLLMILVEHCDFLDALEVTLDS